MSGHSNTHRANVDPAERARFEAIAERWWDPEGEMRPLHELNPARLGFIAERCRLDSARVLDVGCGGGILSESLAAAGAEVVAVDVAEKAIRIARLHLLESGHAVDYRVATVEETLDTEGPERFDVVTCLEMLEHVPHPDQVVAACAALVKPGGHLFFSTINRTLQAYGLAILGAEYVLRLLPRGTHEYQKLIRPSELAEWLRRAGLATEELRGLHYNPLTRTVRLGGDVKVNYLLHGRKPAAVV